MDSAKTIRNSLAEIDRIRAMCRGSVDLTCAIQRVKSIQAARFRRTYADLLSSTHYRPAVEFFLTELYAESDFSKRDYQFAKIADTLVSIFPASVVATAIKLADLHCLTEELDYRMAISFLDLQTECEDDFAKYVDAWQSVGRKTDRSKQLEWVLDLGESMEHLTRIPGLRLMLKLMKNPASTAGLLELQQFLEKGFDTFCTLRKEKLGVRNFLQTISKRESELIEAMFADRSTAMKALSKAAPIIIPAVV